MAGVVENEKAPKCLVLVLVGLAPICTQQHAGSLGRSYCSSAELAHGHNYLSFANLSTLLACTTLFELKLNKSYALLGHSKFFTI